ncbi:hypothetical protein [Anaerococcus marasmi]|uniref:hypothetical protein n=1 Tax=Anaerococcus marasmi TaxID=2057797 RepID=UPI000CF8A068|nr:hypothetical protein [Anaerococcus marasmi]
MAKSDYLISLPEASKLMGWDAQSMREAAKRNKLSFATGYESERGKWIYLVDKNALEKCLAGEKDLFK